MPADQNMMVNTALNPIDRVILSKYTMLLFSCCGLIGCETSHKSSRPRFKSTIPIVPILSMILFLSFWYRRSLRSLTYSVCVNQTCHQVGVVTMTIKKGLSPVTAFTMDRVYPGLSNPQAMSCPERRMGQLIDYQNI